MSVVITPDGITTDRLTLAGRLLAAVAENLQAEGGNPDALALADDTTS